MLQTGSEDVQVESIKQYHPPNFHLSMLPKLKLPRDQQDMVLLMTSVNMRYKR